MALAQLHRQVQALVLPCCTTAAPQLLLCIRQSSVQCCSPNQHSQHQHGAAWRHQQCPSLQASDGPLMAHAAAAAPQGPSQQPVQLNSVQLNPQHKLSQLPHWSAAKARPWALVDLLSCWPMAAAGSHGGMLPGLITQPTLAPQSRLLNTVPPCTSSSSSSSVGAAAWRTVTSSSAAAGKASSGGESRLTAAGGCIGGAVAAEDGGDRSRRRRRGTTESAAVLRRTTESRAAIEDVAVMTKSQLMRRNKPWLAEQCWQQGLSHEGLKDDLVQRLLAWQGTPAGRAAAAASLEAAAAARAALSAATAAAAAAAAAAPAAAAGQALSSSSSSRLGRSRKSTSAHAAASTAATAATAAANAAAPAHRLQQQPLRAGSVAVAAAVAEAAEVVDCEGGGQDAPPDSGSGQAAAAAGNLHSSSAAAGLAAATAAGMIGWQAPASAAAAAAESLGLFLAQLREQPANAAVVAAARRALEMQAHNLLQGVAHAAAGSVAGTTSSSGSSGSSGEQMVLQLAEELSRHSSPESLAALAKACYSREVLDPVIGAALAEAVAAAAAELGPQEMHSVLRLLVEHLGPSGGGGDGGSGYGSGVLLHLADAAGAGALRKAFNALAEGMLRCSAALTPKQLAEAVALLHENGYDDAFGLYLVAKQAAERLWEFEPPRESSWVVVLLQAIADMHIADAGMAADATAAVAAQRDSYSEAQLAAIRAALLCMGAEGML